MALLSQHYGGSVPGMMKAYSSLASATNGKTSVSTSMSNKGSEILADNIPILLEDSDHGHGCNHVIYHYASQVFASLRPANRTDKLYQVENALAPLALSKMKFFFSRRIKLPHPTRIMFIVSPLSEYQPF